MKKMILLVLLAIVTACNTPAPQVAAPLPAYTLPDDSAITKAVNDAYACISFKKNDPNFAGIKNYFIPQAQLINFRSDTAQVTNIDQFVDLYKNFIQGNKVESFYEEEIFGKTEQFGKIAHRISAYKTILNNNDSMPERGVNSFQLIKTPTGWKVSSIIWDVEKPSLPIPAYYLGKDSAKGK